MDITEKAKQERNKYYREWRKKNPDKVREYNKRYWRKKVKEREMKEEKKKA